MGIKCTIGFHDWRKNCEKCSECGKLRQNQHDWTVNCEKCSKCNKTRKMPHDWRNNCDKCFNCNLTRSNQHDWTHDCSRCSKCGTKRPQVHQVSNNWCKVCENTILTDYRNSLQYVVIKIGKQILMGENLRYKIQTDGCWAYNNDDDLADKYGYLYDFETAKLAAKDLPGWHLPTIEEWATLFKYLGEMDEKVVYNHSAGTFDGKFNNEVGKQVYRKIQFRGSSGFDPMMGGVRGSDGIFQRIGSYAYYWSSSDYGYNPFAFIIDNLHQHVGMEGLFHKQGMSVRLFRD